MANALFVYDLKKCIDSKEYRSVYVIHQNERECSADRAKGINYLSARSIHHTRVVSLTLANSVARAVFCKQNALFDSIRIETKANTISSIPISSSTASRRGTGFSLFNLLTTRPSVHNRTQKFFKQSQMRWISNAFRYFDLKFKRVFFPGLFCIANGTSELMWCWKHKFHLFNFFVCGSRASIKSLFDQSFDARIIHGTSFWKKPSFETSEIECEWVETSWLREKFLNDFPAQNFEITAVIGWLTWTSDWHSVERMQCNPWR